MTTVTELAATLTAVDTQLGKATAEILALIQSLRDELINAVLSPEAEAALTQLEAKVQSLDDVVPDVPPVE